MAAYPPFTREQLAQLRSALGRFAPCVVSPGPVGERYRFSQRDKAVEFCWLDHAPEELWIALFENEECLFTMWEEPFTEKDKGVILQHFEAVAARFFDAKTRIARRYWLFGAEQLQYYDGKRWCDIYSWT